MGAYYFYCNLDKREYFSIAVCGGTNKHGGIGRGPTALLLVRLLAPAPVPNSGLLAWAGDRIAVLADDHPVPADIGLPVELLGYDCGGDLLRAEFKDVGADALRTMARYESKELVEVARESGWVFRALAELANSGDREMEDWLRQGFGKDWRKVHGQLLR